MKLFSRRLVCSIEYPLILLGLLRGMVLTRMKIRFDSLYKLELPTKTILKPAMTSEKRELL